MVVKYKRDLRAILYGFIIITLFVGIILFTSKVTIFINLLIWFLFVCIPYFVWYFVIEKLNQILIDESTLEVKFVFRRFDLKEFKFLEIIYVFNINEVLFGYKEKLGPKASKYFDLEIFHNTKKIISLTSFFDGWSEKDRIEIVKKLERFGAKNIN